MPNSDASTDATWSLVDFTTTNANAEMVADLLWRVGVVAIEEIVSDGSRTTLRTSMGEDPDPVIGVITSEWPDVEVQRVEIARSVADTWREHAVPTHVVDDVWLVPAWVGAPNDSRSILLEPLDTFGLGNHPTTVLALRLALAHCDLTDTVFDLGCGSGVLAIAATKLRGASCEVYDIADNAKAAVELNAGLNGVGIPSWSHERPRSPVRTLFANILAPVLIDLAPTILESTTSGGSIVLSGMRTEQVQRVVERFTDTREVGRAEMDGWTAVVLRRPATRT